MSTQASPESAHLADLAIGDRVTVKRVLDHPAWMIQVPSDPRDDRSALTFIPNPTLSEELATTTVLDRREIPAVVGWRGREAKRSVRLASGLWYDCATGLQDGSGATRIQRA